jgi:hypothetical protein
MTDRDYFAAAALTGVLAGRTREERHVHADQWAQWSMQLADAMLAARGVAETPESQHVAETCRSEGHDAAPAATAADVAPSPRQSEIGTGNQQDDGPGKGYRWVEKGELMQAGDEIHGPLQGAWREIKSFSVGGICGVSCVFRRRIAAAPPQPPAAGVTNGDGPGDTRPAGGSAIVEAVAEVVYRAIMYDRGILYGWLSNKSFGAVYEVSLFDIHGEMAQHSARDAAQKILAMTPPAAGVTLTDAERDLLRRLGPNVHKQSCFTATVLSGDERKTAHGLLTRLGGAT